MQRNLKPGLALILVLASFQLSAVEPAGFVLMATGTVEAVQTNQQTRPLKRRSPFFPGESLRTGPEAKAQVRFRDGSLITLRAQTEIRLDEFRFDEPFKGEDKNIFTLVSGGFRTITGKIGKQKPDNYQMKSSVASIGVRGTTYEVVLAQGLNVAAWQGSIVVENQGGRMTLGAEGRYNFAVVSSPRSAPRGSMKPPPAIANEQRQAIQESEDDAAQEEGAAPEEPSESEDSAADDQSEDSEGTLAEQISNDADDPADAPPVVTVSDVDPAPEALEAEPLPSPIPDPILTPVPEPTPTPDPDVDQRLLDVTLDRVGMAVVEGTGYSQMLAGGQAGQDGNAAYHIADNGLDPAETGFATTPFIQVLTQGQAPLGNNMSVNIDANHSVTYGVWEASAGAPAQLRTDAADAAVFTAIDQPIYWVVTDLSADTVVAGRSGQIDYRHVSGFLGGGSGGAVNDVYMNLSVNFDTLAASGEVNIYTASELWQLSLSGSLSQPTLDFTTLTGDVNGSAVQGEFNSLFSGANAQALASSFDLEKVGDPNTYVSGVAVVDDSAVGDLRLSPAEQTSLDRVGIALQVNGQAGAHWFIGPSTAGALNDGPLMTHNGVSPGDPAFASAPLAQVLRDDIAYLSSSYEASTVPVSWGTWQTDVQVQLSAFDPNDSVTLTEPVRWMSVLPSTSGVLAGKSGVARFAPIYAEAVDHNANAFLKFFLGLEVDFDLAQFHGSGVYETPANDAWHFFFDGNITGPELGYTTLNGVRRDSLGNELAIDGALSMLFTGSAAEAIAGAYEFELSSDSTQYITGNFLLGQDLRLSSTEVGSLDRYGVAMTSSGAVGADWFVGPASNGNLGDPLIAENFAHAGDPHFHDLPLAEILKRGATTTQIVQSDTNFPVSWGIWNSGAELHTDPANPGLVSTLAEPVVWMTVLPSAESVVLGRTGRGFYFARQCCAGFGQTDTGYGIDTLSFDLGLDFDSGQFKARLYVYEPDTDFWNVLLGGHLLGTELQVDSLDAVNSYYANYSDALGNTAVDGEFSLVFTGAGAEALAVAYELESAADSSYYLQGAFVAGQDVRLAPGELNAMQQVGVLAGWSNGFGMATTAPMSPVFAHDGMGSYHPGDAWFELASLQTVYRQGGAAEDMLGGHAVAGDPAFQVNWGRWNAAAGTPATYQGDPADAASQGDITTPLYWLTLAPTPLDTLAAKTGQLSYNAPVSVIGAGVDGDVNPASVSFAATVDFDTGALNSGSMHVEHLGGQSWDMNFNAAPGSMTPSGAFQYVSASGLYDGATSANGSMDLILTGAAADGLAGRFNFNANPGVAKDMNGVFLVCQSGGC
ncbi:hypothetical protein Tel_02050 [Candidatus Tenderia electrophaga]|jgi:hypothetical protein|uniref:FecR protein domain-containing protein n=1 Tax=Candidatus Tenderia electrophaga TaxID=1748243 RepID=A0A0S2TA75_9GAMM|nr:hypothetical protein Tel_02050 [Candidatus Tenderia electrophaga]